MEEQLGLRAVFRSDAADAKNRDDSAIRKDYKETQAWGLLTSIDLHECESSTIRDAEKINRFADELNAEMHDVLAYQSLDHLWEER